MDFDEFIKSKTTKYEDILLYHGSRGGLEGDIAPISRQRCDFGRGFYMGENEMQPAGLIVEDTLPMLYNVNLRLSEIDPKRVLELDGREWVYTVLACRKRCAEFNNLDIARHALSRLEKYDVIIGPIADDRMTEAIRKFEEYALTDKGLLACLQSVEYGKQYVCKTPDACSKIEIISERVLSDYKEAQSIRKYSADMREKSRDVVNDMQRKFQRDGLYLNELIDREKNKERDHVR